MSQTYAKDQPAGFINRIERVAIVGAGGHVGTAFAEALVKTGKHTVTTLGRADSTSTLPEGVKRVSIDYDDEGSLVAALTGQQFLIITLSVQAPPEIHEKLVKAAAQAGVSYIMPNVYGYDPFNEGLAATSMYTAASRQRCDEVEKAGVPYVVMVCGFWYEWSLALPKPWLGFDIKSRSVTFFDDGKTQCNLSTWLQCGRGLAALLSLKAIPEDENDTSATVSQWKNKPLYVSTAKISQRDIFDKLHKVLGTTDQDWEIDYEPSDVRYKTGLEELQGGNRLGFAKSLYARMFFPNGDGDFERNLDLERLGLEKDDIDEATKRTVEMVDSLRASLSMLRG